MKSTAGWYLKYDPRPRGIHISIGIVADCGVESSAVPSGVRPTAEYEVTRFRHDL